MQSKEFTYCDIRNAEPQWQPDTLAYKCIHSSTFLEYNTTF